MFIKRISCLFLALLISSSVYSQSIPPKNEVRGIWIATVDNLDWPVRSQTPAQQQANLINQLDELNEAGINLVFFQVRTEGDALYESEIEPWSKYLTGEEGKAPEPFWDPLEFAIEEAHKRGMELHAWLNPYRALKNIPSDFTQKQVYNETDEQVDESLIPFIQKNYDANTPNYKMDTDQRDEMHVSNTHPEWLLVTSSTAIFDPGLPEVIDYTVDVVMDVVNRYDVDGIHFDDYFYPYPSNDSPSNHMTSGTAYDDLDDETFNNYPRDFTNKYDWRRDNINLMVQMVHDSIQVSKPWVKFGISPFGIWKSGTPTGIFGMSSFSTIYADGLAWLEDQTIDYITPQLYWPFGGQQDYGKLAPWWAEKAVENDRHIYPGHGLYRTDRSTFANALFSADEIPSQIQFNRNHDDIDGSVFFRSKNITQYSSKGFADSLKNNYYRNAALPPVMDWKDTTQPNTPENLVVERDLEYEYIFSLNWDAPSEVLAKSIMSSHGDSLIKYAIYRVDSETDPNELDEMQIAENLIAVTGETSYTDITPPSRDEYYYFVTSASRNNVESIPTASEFGGLVTAGSISISPQNLSIDTTMTFTPALSVRNVDGDEQYVPRNKINWTLTDPEVGEISENGVFTPNTVGETGIVANLNVASDTVWVEVAQNEGYVDLNDFTEIEEWSVEANNLDQSLVDVTALDDDKGMEIKYTLPANTTGAEIIISNNILLESVPGFANVRSSSDTSEYRMSLNITNPEDEIFRMNNSTFGNLKFPDTQHFEFTESKTAKITSGASFYFPFTLESINIELPDNNSDEELEGYFRLHEFGVSYTDNPVSNEELVNEAPNQVSLKQNYPNPFNPTTNITFNLPTSDQVNLSVYDILGRKVQTLINGRLQSGNHTYNFNATSLSSGIYIYQLQVGDVSLTKRMTLIK